MPEYLSPGVYVEEVSFRSKSIEGVSTTTTGFVGPCRYGPIDIPPDIVTSVSDFEYVYGDRQKLQFGSDAIDNYLWHGVRAFFEEGGKRVYIARAFKPLAGKYPPADFDRVDKTGSLNNDGHARATAPSAGGDTAVKIRGRFPGVAGNVRVTFTLKIGQNVLGGTPANPTVGSLLPQDVVWISHASSPPSSPPGGGSLYIATTAFDPALGQDTWTFTGAAGTLKLAQLVPAADPQNSDKVRLATLTVTVTPPGDGTPQVWDSLALDPSHQRAGSPDSLSAFFGIKPSNLALSRMLPIVIVPGSKVLTGLDLARALFAAGQLANIVGNPNVSDSDRSTDIILTGGNDGVRPGADEYEGAEDPVTSKKTGLVAFEDIDDISIVAAPGSTFGLENGYRDQADTTINHLIAHAQKMRYRIAVLDSGNGQSIAQVRALRGKIDSSYAALYYPWVRILDPVTNTEVNMPPSGFVAGIYARNDINRAVYKAPANEVVTLALGFEQTLNKGQQDVLNPEGVNCFRFFEGRGFRLWGARTATSDPEWKYVNLRRYFAYLEHSIDKGTQWAVFEPNGENLWANVRRTISDFLLNEWQSGALLGDKPENAYFVKCDRSTMTQNDLDNGRLVCLIGVAPLRPAEFVIFRIGQWTANAKI
jgi:phage tail sheath protein FI